LERAIRIIEREMHKGGSAMLQVKNAGNLVQAFTAMVDASAITASDASKLTAFVQQLQSDDDDDSGAPAAAVYQSQSGNIVETLSGLLEKAQDLLDETRKKETADQHNFDLMKQSLKDEIKFGKKDMAEAKKNLAMSGESKAAAEGDLAVTTKELDADVKAKADLHHACMTKAEDFEAETKSRGEELKALAEAKKVIVESTSGATSISYSFIQQNAEIYSSSDLANFEAVRVIRDLARTQKSAELAQLATRMAEAMRGAQKGSADPFAKVKDLIRNMLDKLEGEAEADATEKAWCDKELAETNQKKDDKTAEIEKLSTKIDSMAAKSSQLKEEIAQLQEGLAKLAKNQVEMDKMRTQEHEAFVSNKADMEKGLEGVKLALKLLGEYYASEGKAHDSADGAGAGVIGLLEVVESDFSKSLAEITSGEESAVSAYEQQTKENEIEKATKTQDVKYKTKESKHLDRTSAELSSDRQTTQVELDAALEYLQKVEARCIAKAETYAEKKARFEAELAGLKEALRILENETAFLQSSKRTHKLRKVEAHKH